MGSVMWHHSRSGVQYSGYLVSFMICYRSLYEWCPVVTSVTGVAVHIIRVHLVVVTYLIHGIHDTQYACHMTRLVASVLTVDLMT